MKHINPIYSKFFFTDFICWNIFQLIWFSGNGLGQNELYAFPIIALYSYAKAALQK